MKDGYFCTKCCNNHYSYGRIGKQHKEFDLELLKEKLVKLYSQPPSYRLSWLSEEFDVEPRIIVRAITDLRKEGIFTDDNSKLIVQSKKEK